MLKLDVKLGDAVFIEGVGTIHVEEKSGRSVRLGFDTKIGPITIQKREPDLVPALARRHLVLD